MIRILRCLPGWAALVLTAAAADDGTRRAADALCDRLCSEPAGGRAWFALRDDGGRGMDCLQVLEDGDGFLGLYHCRAGGRFGLHLAASDDLHHWRHLTELDDHASQGELRRLADGGYLLAYEKDAPNSCWIRLRIYSDRAALLRGGWKAQRDLPRSLAPTAEGTPSIASATVSGESFADADIRLRFHYFEDAKVDRLARGRLSPDGQWQSQRDRELDAPFLAAGFTGNFGDRTAFESGGRTWHLQEVQGAPGDWASWRIALCDGDGRFVRMLPLRTPRGSASFCNPNVAAVRFGGRRHLAVSLFLPSEGNARSEAGQWLFLVEDAVE